MKKIDFKTLIITSIVCLLPMILGIIYYGDLPQEMAVHFGLNNEPDNFMSKNFTVFGMPILMVLLQCICCISTDIGDKNKEQNRKITLITKWIIPVTSIVIYSSIILYALGTELKMQVVACIILGIVMILVGNYLPKAEPKERDLKKYSRDFLKKENRYLGYSFVILGFVWIISAFLSSTLAIIILIITLLLCIVIIPILRFKFKE